MTASSERENKIPEPPSGTLATPPWLRELASPDREQASLGRPPRVSRIEEGGKLNWPPPPAKLACFESNLNIRELRCELSVDPNCVPASQMHARRRPAMSPVTKLSLYGGLVAFLAYGAVELSLSQGDAPLAAIPASGVAAVMASSLVTASPLATKPVGAQPAVPARLVVQDRQTFADEPLPLGVALYGVTGAEALVFTGLTEGTRLSAGEPVGANGWRIPAREVANVLAHAPKSFVGIMTAAVELRSSADAHVDTKFARLEWVAPGDARAPRSIKPNEISAPSQPASPLPQQQQPPAAIPRISPELMSRLVRRGQDLLKNGDIAAARLVLRPAADAGNAQAALMLGASFDPIFLAEIKVVGLAGDRATASAWYQRAMEFGIDRNAVLGTVRQMIDPIPDKADTSNLEAPR